MQKGGIVDKPTYALLGEAGPEAVVPLARQVAGIAAIGESETGFNRKEAYSDFYNDPRKFIGRKRNPGYNANVAKMGERGADYGFFQMNQTDVDDAIRRGMDPEMAKHLMGGGKQGTSSPDEQVAALHQYLSLKYPSFNQLGETGQFEAFRKAASRQFFGLSRSRGLVAKQAFEGTLKGLTEDSRVTASITRSVVEPQKVEGDASLRIDLNGFPRGTKTAAEANGMFKEVKMNRGPSMALAGENP
jgi:hypothetical protein